MAGHRLFRRATVRATAGWIAVACLTAFAPPPAQATRQERSDRLDAEAATAAYLAKVPAEKKARSDAYFEGGYWLLLWGFLYGAAANGLLLHAGWSARMRNLATRLTRVRALHPAVYWLQYLLLTTVLLFPLRVYQDFIREHQYGLATQTFASWLGDQAKALGLAIVLGTLALVAFYAVLRRSPRRWWLWGSIVAIIFVMFISLIAPVFILPVFNTYTKLEDPRVRDPILRMARANGLATEVVYQMDASRQTTRISANVSGFLGTERITLNDNLLNRASLPEVKAVMGHEIGHYVLNHVYELILFFSIIITVGFGLINMAFGRVTRRWGGRWEIQAVDDVAGFPLIVLLFSVYGFLLTPIVNTSIRANEYEADVFGLNASREPDGFAEVSLKLGEYRKLDPGPVEEWIFFDHPSGRTRIFTAMRWKAALKAGAQSP